MSPHLDTIAVHAKDQEDFHCRSKKVADEASTINTAVTLPEAIQRQLLADSTKITKKTGE